MDSDKVQALCRLVRVLNQMGDNREYDDQIVSQMVALVDSIEGMDEQKLDQQVKSFKERIKSACEDHS